jgi:hypothetical protein
MPGQFEATLSSCKPSRERPSLERALLLAKVPRPFCGGVGKRSPAVTGEMTEGRGEAADGTTGYERGCSGAQQNVPVSQM